MENANSRDYLEKIKIQVIENLRQTAHAPSVQTTDVPRTDMLGAEDNDDLDAELDDEDEDTNMDVRTTERREDQRIEKDNEFYDSDEENQSRSNGGQSQNGQRKRRNIMDYQNPNAVSDVEMDSGMPSPSGSGEATTEPALTSMPVAVKEEETVSGDKEKVNADDVPKKEDVEMGDADEVVAETSNGEVAKEQEVKEKSKEPETRETAEASS